jgi:hypothetical protein
MMVQELGKGEKRKFAFNHEDECCPRIRSFHNHLFLEQAEGYVKALEKSTSRVLSSREVFEHCVQTGLE